MLEKIKIASPCKANWEQMVGDERVRHCAECDLDVYNFSAMTRQEVERLVQEREGRLCARFYRRADGSMLTQDCPVGFRARVRRVSRVAGTAIAAAMSVVPGWAQDTKPKPPLVQLETDEAGLELHVVDAEGNAVGGIQVSIFDKSERTSFTSPTDGHGDVRFLHLRPGTYAISADQSQAGAYEIVSLAKQTITKRALKLDIFEVSGNVLNIVENKELSELPLLTRDRSKDTPDMPPAKVRSVPMPQAFPKK